MSDLIETVIKTRELSARIAAQCLSDIDNASEIEIHESILEKMSVSESIFPRGWYDPPIGGVSVLFDEAPFERLKYDSLRNPLYWSSNNTFKAESVASIYFSPVDRQTGVLGDIGFTIYKGKSDDIKKHLKKCHDAVYEIAEYVKVGMKVSDLCLYAKSLFANKLLRRTRWVAINSDPNQTINLGHSVPGTFEKDFTVSENFEEMREIIKSKRVPLIDTENFKFPETCAFVVESRLEDFNNPSLPSAYFQFFVCFNGGKKTILDYGDIFKIFGMDYMKS